MVIIVKITEDRNTINNTANGPTANDPTLIGQSDKKDYIVKLELGPESEVTPSNVIGLRLYLGCHKVGDNTTTTNNCRLSVINNDDNNQIYSAIDPRNPDSNDTGDVLRYIIPDEDITELTRVGSSGIEIKVQLETSQDSAIDRTPIIMNEVYVLEAHIEYALKERIEVIQCSTQAADASVHFEVIDQ